MAAVSDPTAMAFKSYQSKAEVLVKDYLISEPFIPYSSVFGGLLVCKMVYDLTQLISTFYLKSYNGLTKLQRIEWNNRGISTVHAVFISAMSLYFVFWSDLFSDRRSDGLVIFRNSPLSTFSLGVSVGYFLADLGMILWLYPSLGGMEYVIHHSLSGIAVAYSMFSGEGQLYTYMVLISEVTTPEINMRWFLDMAGMKRSNAYLINGVVIFFAWLIARILLFIYIFNHVYLHYNEICSLLKQGRKVDQLQIIPNFNLEWVMQMHVMGYLLVLVVPSALGIMNLMWFAKIVKGLKKTLAKRQ